MLYFPTGHRCDLSISNVSTGLPAEESHINMFNQAFYSKVEGILTALRGAETVSMAVLGRCLSALEKCLLEAEVNASCVRVFTDSLMDRFAAEPAVTGPCLAGQVQALLSETPGLQGDRLVMAAWQDATPAISGASRWDIKELDNSIAGFNLASLSRLRRALGLASERRLSGALDWRGLRCFKACGTLQSADRHDAGIDGEQINRLIRYLGWGDPGADPHGGRPAVLG
jgi:hypothetical protein